MSWERIDALLQRENKRLLAWQAVVIALFVSGYSGYYLCRSNLSVAMPFIIGDMVRDGYDPDYAKVALGTIASVGVFFYAIGKFVSGGVTDFLGGRLTFLGGMLGSVIFTIMFALFGSVPIFTLAWIGNRMVQSLGWVGMVKVTSRWFSYSSYGTVMGIISLSYLFGDAASRAFMGWLLAMGVDWRGVFVIGATILFGLFALSFFLLKESPKDIGEPEPPGNPTNLFADSGDDARPESVWALVRPFFRNRDFVFVCLLSLGFTLLRETFNTWTPTYFSESLGLNGADAATSSALFPLLGGFSVVLAGFASDRIGRGGRSLLLFLGLLLSAVGLMTLAWTDFGGSRTLPVFVVGAIAFVMIGPYSYLGGAMALDFGGKQGSATACGIIDGIGYLGGILAGDSVARLSVAFGWEGAFGVLASVAVLFSIPALLMLLDERRRSPVYRTRRY
jgi:OPA family glycerol-3-phosphate transporter-like MFS transporter